MGRLAVLGLAFLWLFALRADAQTQQRVALVIGNGTYQDAGTLANPVNDALDMAARLRALGFEVVEGHDLGKREMERTIGEFSDKLAGADVGLLFYAGHGLQVDGRNFLVPVDARLDMPAKLRLESVQLDDIVDIIGQQAKTSLVFLDACRNNPFARSLNANSPNRSAAALAGLARVDSARGSFVAFSTSPGAVALDGTGRNSPFAAALLRHMDTKGQSINDMMIAVRNDVASETRGAQNPWDQSSLTERFEFVPGEGVAAVPKPTAPPQTQVAALERSVGDVASVEEFLRTSYLAPETSKNAQSVGRLYDTSATIFGTPLDNAAIVKAKTDWFAQWSGWSLTLEPGSLQVTPLGENRADAVFAMSYDYVPKAKAAARAKGKARVKLELVKTDGTWRIASETSEAMP
ncbi:caspase domain-containing protein [Corticibacterium sp. UT-5YL-CI-8]|nr:caspase domain-containing protein [Tianweitania sp. UT-5YL-CI-8]